MQIRTILVNLDLDRFSPSLVHCAATLASRFGAGLLGHASAEPATAMMGYEGAAFAADLYDRQRKDIEERLPIMEAQFRAQLPADIRAEWRGSLEAPNPSVSRIARCADLIMTETNFDEPSRSGLRSMDVGDLLLSAGRPVLLVAAGLSEIRADPIVVGWKDSREARRAVADALPLLKAARQVVVATIHEDDLGAEHASLEDLLGWLRRHEVDARGEVHPAADGPAATLESIARDCGADLVVTGGYGRSRLREWLFGGMTRDLLSNRTVHRLMSN